MSEVRILSSALERFFLLINANVIDRVLLRERSIRRIVAVVAANRQVDDHVDVLKNGEIDIMEYYNGKILANVACGTSTRWTAKWDSAPLELVVPYESLETCRVVALEAKSLQRYAARAARSPRGWDGVEL